MNRYIWLAFTDKYGIIWFGNAYSVKFVEQVLKSKGCKDFEIHLTDQSTYYFFIQNYLENCLQLEYVKD